MELIVHATRCIEFPVNCMQINILQVWIFPLAVGNCNFKHFVEIQLVNVTEWLNDIFGVGQEDVCAVDEVPCYDVMSRFGRGTKWHTEWPAYFEYVI